MNSRLTFNEIDLLKKALQCLEAVGHGEINDSPVRNEETYKFFGRDRPRLIDTTNRLRLLREKIETIAGG